MENKNNIARGVLVVEADPDSQCHLARLLKSNGYRVVGTSSGDGALTLLSHWPVELVIVAEDLPGMDGVTLARRILENRPNVNVVLTLSNEEDTRRDEREVRTHARLAGVSTFLTRPIAAEELLIVCQSSSSADLTSDPVVDPTTNTAGRSIGVFGWNSPGQDAAE